MNNNEFLKFISKARFDSTMVRRLMIKGEINVGRLKEDIMKVLSGRFAKNGKCLLCGSKITRLASDMGYCSECKIDYGKEGNRWYVYGGGS